MPADGALYATRVADADYGGSGNHFYRIAAGEEPYVSAVFPLGVARGETSTVRVDGVNLGGEFEVSPAADAEPGTLVEVVPRDGPHPLNRRTVVVCEGPQGVESEPNDEPGKAGRVATPGGVSGRIGRDGDVDHFRFEARKGERLIVEVFGRRLGTPVDPVIEIVDGRGKPCPARC